ncbi:MAG: hypothetical protein NVSMB9_04030 [Isosphaeraceae bacterium]
MKKEMLINVLQPEECRIAIVEDGVLEELYVERTSLESYTGNIYKGRIVNLEPAIQAAFVDFSVGRNGFLHVSDVEPQYYDRHPGADTGPRDRDREREVRRDRGRGRPDERAGGSPPPTRGEERLPRDRERPDRMEKGGRDRSEPRARRFGEGLISEEDQPKLPPAPTSRAPDPLPRLPERPFELEETGGARPEPPRPAWDTASPPGRHPERERDLDRESRPAPGLEQPRGRGFGPSEPFDPDLPPSRTQRFRPLPPAPRAPESESASPDAEIGRFRPPVSPFEPGAEPSVESDRSRDRERERERDPRRGRGGRGGRGPRHQADPQSLFETGPGFTGPESEPHATGPVDPEPPRRRGGRAAIRSRGGDREPAIERPRERLPEPEVERFRPGPAPSERERARSLEPEPPRDRSRPHDRAGEPGYVPRRERSRAPEGGTGPGPGGITDWPDLGPESEFELDVEPTTEGADDDTSGPSGKLEGPRRRRRRRGRRRERDRPGDVPGLPAGELDADLDDDFDDDAPLETEAPGRASKPAVDALARNFDFGDETDADRGHETYEDEEDLGDDLQGTEGEEAATRSPEDDQIDPELEEEIRREIEEIAELEREMGLRGTTEARPRRGDDREPDPGGRAPRGRGMVKPPVQEIFRRGDEVLIQVIKESIGTKGPTLSTYISIPGRYLVLMPGLNRVGVSRKIADEGQRRKLRDIMNDLNPPKGLGFIVRTAGLERTKRELARDLAYLLRLWKVILRRIKKARAPAPIYQESDMITRTIRDIFTSEIDTIWIDEPQAFERAQEFLRVVMPRFVDRLKLYDERVPLFHKYGIEDEIAKIQRRRIDLPEGGSIVIDQTEALVAIDVNSGNFRVENDAERTAYEMNLRAAKEIARQLRLRDLGGVIVNDFIDMREERHRRGVEKALRDAIKRDRARTKVLRMSAFGLIEMTRQRIRPSLKRSVYEDCPNCTGAGVVKTVESMSIDVIRLLALASHREDIRRVNISVSAPVATHLNNRKRREVTRLESEFNMTIHIRPEENVPAEHLMIECFDGNNGEIRLLPAPPPGSRRPLGHS